ncbi:MAG: hypothetical protein HY305_04345 [Sphingobacteriales bacterium]|nr:hypothetical protein [Sphingobacteriales bacterium]
MKKILLALTCIMLVATISTQAQKKERKREFYFSWGYNTESYTNSNVRITQHSLGNNFTFVNVNGRDHKGWNEGIFNQAISIPQYNYRLGLILNRKRGIGVEINFDHTKFIFADQTARLKGTLNGRQVDTLVNFNKANGYYYYLNNGANFLLFNIVKRWHLYANQKKTIQIDGLGKFGIGPVIPHVENGFLLNDSTNPQKPNEPHFQIGGWNIGAEGAIRATFFKNVYLEYSNKVDYARYSNLKIYEGTARHAFGTYEMILSLGITLPTGKRLQ